MAALKYSDLPGLERSIDDAYSIASQRLLEVFFDKFALLDHLRALKAYLMLGAGDFAELLMEAMAYVPASSTSPWRPVRFLLMVSQSAAVQTRHQPV